MDSYIKKFLLTKETYEKSQPLRIAILNGDKEIMNCSQSVISEIIADQTSQPMTKLLAVQFAKDCIETFNDVFISSAQMTILQVFEKEAHLCKKYRDSDRGRLIFTNEPGCFHKQPQLAQIGNSYLRLILECIWVWSKWFPIDPETLLLSAYKVTFEKLLLQGVTFSKIIYFKYSNVVKNIPNIIIPIAMLQQCIGLVKNDLIRNVLPSSTQSILSLLSYHLQYRPQDMKNRKDIFYHKIFQRAVTKVKKQAKKISHDHLIILNKEFEQNKSQWKSVSHRRQESGNNTELQELRESNILLQKRLKNQEIINSDLQTELNTFKTKEIEQQNSQRQSQIFQRTIKPTQNEMQFSRLQSSKSTLRIKDNDQTQDNILEAKIIYATFKQEQNDTLRGKNLSKSTNRSNQIDQLGQQSNRVFPMNYSPIKIINSSKNMIKDLKPFNNNNGNIVIVMIINIYRVHTYQIMVMVKDDNFDIILYFMLKATFRTVLIFKFTDNQQNVSMENLRDYLKENNVYNEEILKTYIEQFELLIEELINANSPEDQDQIFEQYGLQASQNAEILQVWNAEKDNVYSHIIKLNTHSNKLDKIQWSVNNQFYGRRHKNINQVSCLVNLKAKDVNGNKSEYHTFEMNRDDVTYIEDQLKKIENTITALLL